MRETARRTARAGRGQPRNLPWGAGRSGGPVGTAVQAGPVRRPTPGSCGTRTPNDAPQSATRIDHGRKLLPTRREHEGHRRRPDTRPGSRRAEGRAQAWSRSRTPGRAPAYGGTGVRGAIPETGPRHSRAGLRHLRAYKAPPPRTGPHRPPGPGRHGPPDRYRSRRLSDGFGGPPRPVLGHRDSAAHGVYTDGRGAVAMPLPRKKLGCGGWLYAVFCQARAVRYWVSWSRVVIFVVVS